MSASLNGSRAGPRIPQKLSETSALPAGVQVRGADVNDLDSAAGYWNKNENLSGIPSPSEKFQVLISQNLVVIELAYIKIKYLLWGCVKNIRNVSKNTNGLRLKYEKLRSLGEFAIVIAVIMVADGYYL